MPTEPTPWPEIGPWDMRAYWVSLASHLRTHARRARTPYARRRLARLAGRATARAAQARASSTEGSTDAD